MIGRFREGVGDVAKLWKLPIHLGESGESGDRIRIPRCAVRRASANTGVGDVAKLCKQPASVVRVGWGTLSGLDRTASGE